MPSTDLTAIALVDADGRTIRLDTENRLEELLVQFLNLFLSRNLFLLSGFWFFDNGLLFLDGILHFAVFLVHRIGQVFDTKHIAMVGEGNAIHPVFLAFRNQIGHFRHAVEHGIMRVDMQVGEVHRDIVAKFRLVVNFLFVSIIVGYDHDFRRLNHIGIGRTEIGHELWADTQSLLVDDAATHQLQENASRGLNVG